MKKQWISILIVGLTFGTAWAIRGQFGHEQGAAWAGGIGALSLVLASQRKDWYAKVLLITLSSAIGWGAGGMISYGKVVGYGRSIDFLNASYGLLMLFVIGALFGLLGGGFVGLTLGSSSQKRVNWGSLLAEMAAGGLITYSFLIDQLEILMTPPRSEAWAVCLGAGLAMVWHMMRNNYKSPLRVAMFSALGAGFGFACGNFLQILGNVLEINFNMWNVMEYSIGFFGGISMAYGVFSSEWPEESSVPERWENRTALLLTFIFIPVIVFNQSRLYEVFSGNAAENQNLNEITSSGSIAAAFIIVAMIVIGWIVTIRSKDSLKRKDVMVLFVLYFASYIFISYCVTGAFSGIFLLNHHLYAVNILVVLVLLGQRFPAFINHAGPEMKGARWLQYFAVIIVIIIILTLILINIHGEMTGANARFPYDPQTPQGGL
jgi:heme/copper-type cytochrome/quinol oxidase subunit 2